MTLYHLFSTALLSTCLLVSTHGGPPRAEELIPPAQADLHFRVGGEGETSLLAALGAVAGSRALRDRQALIAERDTKAAALDDEAKRTSTVPVATPMPGTGASAEGAPLLWKISLK